MQWLDLEKKHSKKGLQQINVIDAIEDPLLRRFQRRFCGAQAALYSRFPRLFSNPLPSQEKKYEGGR